VYRLLSDGSGKEADRGVPVVCDGGLVIDRDRGRTRLVLWHSLIWGNPERQRGSELARGVVVVTKMQGRQRRRQRKQKEREREREREERERETGLGSAGICDVDRDFAVRSSPQVLGI